MIFPHIAFGFLFIPQCTQRKNNTSHDWPKFDFFLFKPKFPSNISKTFNLIFKDLFAFLDSGFVFNSVTIELALSHLLFQLSQILFRMAKYVSFIYSFGRSNPISYTILID